MFKEKKSYRLALFVAITLGGTGFLSSAHHVSAADVTGQRAEISGTKVPADNVVDADSGVVIGSAAGMIGHVADSGNVADNTLTFNGRALPYDKFLFGGITFGSGNVTRNKIFVNQAGALLTSSTEAVYGGMASGGGSVENNDAEFSGDHLNNDMAGGVTNMRGAGLVKGNTAVLKGGSAHGDIYGGIARNGANGDVVGNTAIIEGGSATALGKAVYGGFTDGTGKVEGNRVIVTGGSVKNVYGGHARSGDATGNTVTITGGTVQNIDGGRSPGGNATGNTVNLGDGKSDYAGQVNGVINGGSGMTYGADYRTGNTLNVYDNAGAANIRNFAKINFHFNEHVNKTAAMLTLSDAGGTTIGSLGELTVEGAHNHKGTLIKNAHGVAVSDGVNYLAKTEADEYKELILATSADSKQITYEGYAFAHQNTVTTAAEGTDKYTWGGRSVLGNATHHNAITVDSGTHKNVYGGWTSGTGTEAADKDSSDHNEVTFGGAGTRADKIYGGYADTDAGKAEHNTVTVNNGKVSAAVYGGAARGAGNADSNTVRIKGAATEIASIYGGFARGTGNATGNKVYFDAGTVSFAEWMVGGQVGRSGNAEDNLVEVNGGKTSSLYGGVSSSSDATGHILRNHVRVHRGTIDGKVYGGVLDEARATGDVTHNTVMVKGGVLKREIYGGAIEKTNSTGSVMNNEVTIAGGEVKDVLGGFVRGSGKLTGNVVTITGGKIQGTVYAARSNGNSEIKDNIVNLGDGKNELAADTEIAKYIYGAFKGDRASYAGNTLNVKASAHAKNIVNFNKVNFYFTDTLQPKLTLRDSMGTKLGSLNDITVHGSPHASSGTLIENNTSGGITIRDGVTSVVTTGDTAEMTLSKSGDNKKINYTRLIFKGARAAETDGSDAWGGRSVIGNTTTDNIVAVDSGTYTNVYGGWTSGVGSTADSSKQKDSTLNKVTIGGTAAISGTVYGGLTDVAGGKATGNTVMAMNNLNADIVGGKSAGEASGNTVTVGSAAVNSITGGDGATTKDNTVNIDGATVANKIVGGTQADGTGNTLNVKGVNTARNIGGFQNLHFDTTGATGTMLTLSDGTNKTKVDWNTLTVGGSGHNITLLKNAAGIDFGGTYTDGAVKSGLSADRQSEINVGVSVDKKAITYSGYRFTGVAQALVDGTAVYGGISKAGNATHHNAITVNGNYDAVYGGHTSGTSDTAAQKKHSHDNTVTITGGTLGKVYGGYTDSTDGTTNDNTVSLGDGTHPLAPNTTVAALYGGNKTAAGNTLNVNTSATVGTIGNFSKVTFKENATLRLQAAGVKFDLAAVKADFAATAQEKTLVESDNALELAGGKTFWTDLSADGTKETNIEARSGNKEIVRYGYTFKDARTATTVGAETWGGRSKAGNTTTGNEITLSSGTYTNVYGGWTSGAGSTADSSKQKDSTLNKVTIGGTASVNGTVYGGLTDVTGGKATGNTVMAMNNLNADIVGGKSAGEASGNTVTVGSAAVNSITGGDGATTKDNTVNIDGATVANKIVGGTQADGTGNTLNVKGVNTARNIGGFQNLHFDTTGATGTMLTLSDGTNKTKVDWNTLTVGGSGHNITLLKNAAGIDFGGTYTDGAVKSGLSADRQSEINVGVSVDKKAITYSGYRFTGVAQALVDGTAVYGGISKAGNATHHNAITVNGNYDAVYGGHTSGTSDTAAQKKHSHDNTVTITGGTLGKVYGGYTDSTDGTTNDNTVSLGDGTHPLAPNTTVAALYGGNKTAAGNTLNVNTSATVGTIGNFSKVTFKENATLRLQAAGVKFDLAAVKADFAATAQEKTLVESDNALELAGGKTFWTDLSADGTKETNIEARSGNKEIVRYGYTFKDARTATTVGAETWGGRSKAGNTTTGNEITLSSGTYTNVYGGWTSGVGSTADSSKQKDSTLNKVTIGGTAAISGTVYGGLTDVAGGKATGNTVMAMNNLNADIVGGKAAGEASGNTVSIDHAAVNSVTGGYGAVTNNNRINLRGAKVTGIVTGGTAASGTGNTLAVSYGMKTTEIGDFRGIQNLHFDMEKAPMDGTAHTMLKLTNVGGEKKLSDAHIDLRRDGAAEKLKVGDKITLMENTSGGITFGENLTAKGTDGVTRDYEFAIASVDKTLIATVTKTSLGEQSKSFVETRTGASAFLNDGADFMAGAGLDAAKAEAARAAAAPGSAAYGLWAGLGGGALRHNTGSYVKIKGWNLGVGWARENAVPAGTLTFGPFLEYGRGSYDSYLDDGTHGDGTSSYIGAGVVAELAMRGGIRVDGTLRAGRTKSDYTGLASYDTSNAYYGIQAGAGKDFRVSEAAAVSAYVRYAYTHTAGASAHLSTGETYEFDAVNSHRVRLGTRWTHGDTAHTQLYAGLAWEYEFDGAAHASYQGDRTPSPSLKGGSALLELGYRFAPKSSRVRYDLHLNGWQGKREGITGGVSVKWMF